MVPERAVDPAMLYERERLAFVAFLGTLRPEELSITVPASPEWTVRDVLSHVVGITADLNAQRFDAVDADAWTRAQVDQRRHRSLDEVAAEWDREAPTFEGGLRLFGYGLGAHYLGDLLQHVGDVHAALGRSPVRDDESVAVGLDFYLESFEETLRDTGLGPVRVRVGDEEWVLGDGAVALSLTAPRYELFRALGGRRTRDEIRALAWVGDADAVVDHLSRYPLPVESLGEGRSTGSTS